MKTIEDLLGDHPFFEGLSRDHMALLSGCGKNVVFEEGDDVFREGQAANHFYVIRHGRVSIDIRSAGRDSVRIETLEDGNVLGWSWLVPPYQWHFDAKAVLLTRAVALDAECLRGKCEADPNLGYEMYKRFSRIMMDRLMATRLQLLDLYGKD